MPHLRAYWRITSRPKRFIGAVGGEKAAPENFAHLFLSDTFCTIVSFLRFAQKFKYSPPLEFISKGAGV
jgi:hypothetical protein